jgi:hypothetical protein
MTILDINNSRGGNPKALLSEPSMPDSVCRLQMVRIVNGRVRVHGGDGFVGFLERRRHSLRKLTLRSLALNLKGWDARKSWCIEYPAL